MNIIKSYLVLYFLTAGSIYALGSKEIEPENNVIISSVQQNAIQQTNAEPSRAEQVMRALAGAYPRQIDKIEYRNNDWAVLLSGTWYHYAEGKLLPQNMVPNAANYSPQPFYNYIAELPVWKVPTAEEAERYRSMANNRNQNPPRRSPQFFDELWRAHNRSEAYDRVKTIRFLGKSVTVHYLILENLSLVEEQILAAAKVNPQVQSWINSVSSLEGWSWRNIADTQSRSYHSYGLAVDIIPKSYGGKETYWLWASNRRSDWWNISYNERYHPPAAVIKAFETYGFIWGGKWLYFDTMHFEYRPEILILSGMPPDTRR
ncbi:MAG: M15 family metallopeptidase [Spirochaetes bacterium]|nr:M15 family metallopeptidase [Spirochaetota bacterium]